jgi:LPPG:FO 2-phospho-L-lactate transferase
VQVVPPGEVVAIVNTGDDAVFHGLHVAPDLDIVMYTLAGIVEPSQGWGVQGDSYATLEQLRRYGRESWFLLGDRDFATHIARTELLREGLPLSEVTDRLRRALGVETRLLPMTDAPVGTQVRTPEGVLAFQEYFVHRRAEPEVLEILYGEITSAPPAPGVLESIAEAEVVAFAPSNPLVSLGTILALPGVRPALQATRARRVAISPIVGGGTIKGPADRMMRGLGWEVSAFGVANAYRDLLDVIVIDEQDADLAERIRGLGLGVLVTDTIMRDGEAKRRLAAATLGAARGAPRG